MPVCTTLLEMPESEGTLEAAKEQLATLKNVESGKIETCGTDGAQGNDREHE